MLLYADEDFALPLALMVRCHAPSGVRLRAATAEKPQPVRSARGGIPPRAADGSALLDPSAYSSLPSSPPLGAGRALIGSALGGGGVW